MILIDANLFLYASLRELPRHPQARAWLDEVLNGDQLVGLPWMVVLAVLRISTNPRVLQQPLPADQALGLIEGWLDHPLVQTIEPGIRPPISPTTPTWPPWRSATTPCSAPPTTISIASGVCGIATRSAEPPLPTTLEVPVATAIQAHR